jgi:hypothetical protein
LIGVRVIVARRFRVSVQGSQGLWIKASRSQDRCRVERLGVGLGVGSGRKIRYRQPVGFWSQGRALAGSGSTARLSSIARSGFSRQAGFDRKVGFQPSGRVRPQGRVSAVRPGSTARSGFGRETEIGREASRLPDGFAGIRLMRSPGRRSARVGFLGSSDPCPRFAFRSGNGMECSSRYQVRFRFAYRDRSGMCGSQDSRQLFRAGAPGTVARSRRGSQVRCVLGDWCKPVATAR